MLIQIPQDWREDYVRTLTPALKDPSIIVMNVIESKGHLEGVKGGRYSC